MSRIPFKIVERYLPANVKRIIARSGDCWIGEVDNSTVLKYPQILGKISAELQIEAKMYKILKNHPRIVRFKGITEDGILLKFTPNEGVNYIHSKRILHCDLRHDNLLLYDNLDLKLADFQGQHFSTDGVVLLDALSLESTKSYLPRTPADHARVKTDLFALGSTMYFIIMGHDVFPDLNSTDDEEEIERRFRAQEFPNDRHACHQIASKCWNQQYRSAEEVLVDLKNIQNAVAYGERLEGLDMHTPHGESPELMVPWLSGICDAAQAPKVPPRVRQLVGYE
ncbi:kinase-like domain-containing protein [Phaeosphaeriaceae sp. PMI808]|nr:kinase-like domain-containing protein [Phaeosphaeriaceae sp. PMI808]